MRNLLILLLVPMLVSCQVLTATTSVIAGSTACSVSEKKRSFPSEGAIKKIDLSLTISDRTHDVSFSETAVCTYQGSICGGGTWFEVWYSDKPISHSIPLALGDELVFQPQSFCTKLDDYSQQCKLGNCDPVETFKLLFIFSESRKANTVVGGLDWTIGKFHDRALLKVSDLPSYGYEVKHFSIEITDES